MAGRADLNTVDRDALERAMEICAQRDPSRAKQLEGMLQRDPWTEVAEFAAYSSQIDALALKPWQSPPCHEDEGDPNPYDRDAQILLRRMLAAGVSRYDPDPMRALQRAKRHRK